jgi:hypothetical protein
MENSEKGKQAKEEEKGISIIEIEGNIIQAGK